MFIPLATILPSQPVGFRHCLSTLLMIPMVFFLRLTVIVHPPAEPTHKIVENRLKCQDCLKKALDGAVSCVEPLGYPATRKPSRATSPPTNSDSLNLLVSLTVPPVILVGS